LKAVTPLMNLPFSDARLPAVLVLCAGLLGCVPQAPEVRRTAEPGLIPTLEATPADAPPGSCWGKQQVAPPQTATVTETVLVQPAQLTSTGEVLTPPIYRREPRQQVVKPARYMWFETPCAEAMTPEFIATVQRALQARMLYSGPISGEMNQRTRSAIRRFQEPQGLASGVLSLMAARQLGLAPALAPKG